MEILDEKKKTVCRVCLSYNCEMFGGGLSLFEKYNDVYVYEKINYIASIEIAEGDNLPDRICSVCVSGLENACNFKQQCESSDAFLHSESEAGKSLQKLVNVPVKEEGIDEFEYEHNIQLYSPSPSERQQSEKNLNGEETNVYREEPMPKPFVSKAIDLKLECDDCGEIFRTKCKLKVHWKKVHMLKQLICSDCKQTHKTYKAYHNHIKRKTQSCVNASKVRVEGQGKSRIFHCKFCDASSKRIQTMLAHLVTHTGERPFPCDKCDRAFSQHSSLMSHKECAHKTYTMEMTCERCGLHFKGRTKWFRHLRSHKNERWPCTVCKKQFTLKQTLQSHMIRHSGVKSFTCEICAKTFYTSSDLRNHKVKIHFKSSIYSCNHCEYKTWNYNCMAKHRPRHTGNKIACNVCGRFVDNEQQLVLHKKRHFEKNYKCSYCDKFYFSKKSLGAHVKSKHNVHGIVTKVEIKNS